MQTTYSNYYEIYMQKRDKKGEQKYCLLKNNSNLFLLNKTETTKEDVPMVEFVDIDRDGMIDLFFIQDNNLYVYYNTHLRKEIVYGLGESYLCLQ
jgi:hypothetical protein